MRSCKQIPVLSNLDKSINLHNNIRNVAQNIASKFSFAGQMVSGNLLTEVGTPKVF